MASPRTTSAPRGRAAPGDRRASERTAGRASARGARSAAARRGGTRPRRADGHRGRRTTEMEDISETRRVSRVRGRGGIGASSRAGTRAARFRAFGESTSPFVPTCMGDQSEQKIATTPAGATLAIDRSETDGDGCRSNRFRERAFDLAIARRGRPTSTRPRQLPFPRPCPPSPPRSRPWRTPPSPRSRRGISRAPARAPRACVQGARLLHRHPRAREVRRGEEGRVPLVGVPHLLQRGRQARVPWHGVPLRNADGTCNFICEIPKETKAKMEVATDEPRRPSSRTPRRAS